MNEELFLTETTITEDRVSMTLADHSDLEKADQWIEIRLKMGGTSEKYLPEIRRDLLKRATDVLNAEIKRQQAKS